MNKQYIFLGAILVSTIYFGVAHAWGTVNVNGTSYVCTTSCNVTTSSSGKVTVKDCCGGKAFKEIT